MSWRPRYYERTRAVGFYEPAEGGGDAETTERAGEIDWITLYGAITSRTNWTPKQINELTLGQLHSYVRYWTVSSSSESGDNGLLFNDIGTFNETAGISRVRKQV